MGTRVLTEFEYFKPWSIEEAISLSKKHGDKAKFLAGGTDLLIDMKLLRVEPEYLIDIRGLNELKGITFDEKGLRVGATTLLSEVSSFPLVREKYTALFEAVSQMATTQIRNIATIGGNLCNASPGADTVPPLLVFDTKVDIATQSGMKTVPLEEFFIGPGETILNTGDILISILLPASVPDMGTSFIKISRTHSDLPQLNVAVALRADNGVCEDVRIALGAVAPTPIRAREAEAALRNKELSQDSIEEAANTVAEEINPRTSIRSTSDYRIHVAPVIAKRALLKAYERIHKSRGGENG